MYHSELEERRLLNVGASVGLIGFGKAGKLNENAIGPGRLLDSGERCPVALAIGDEVLFAKYGGTDIEIEKKREVKILRESDILAKVV